MTDKASRFELGTTTKTFGPVSLIRKKKIISKGGEKKKKLFSRDRFLILFGVSSREINKLID